MWPFTPAWKSKNPDKAVKAVAKISDQDRLALVAETACSEPARIAAVKKLDSLDLLGSFERRIGFKAVSLAAQERIEAVIGALQENSEMVRLAAEHKNPAVREAAVDRITDKKVLYRIAIKHNSTDTCLQAIRKIHDNTVLAKIVKNVNNLYLRVAAAD